MFIATTASFEPSSVGAKDSRVYFAPTELLDYSEPRFYKYFAPTELEARSRCALNADEGFRAPSISSGL
jgi:hypothetical protein